MLVVHTSGIVCSW